MSKINKDNFAYLGIDYQLRLMSQLITDSKFANSIIDIIDPNYFDDQYLRIIAATIIDAKNKFEIIPDVSSLQMRLLEEVTDPMQRKFVLSQFKKVQEATLNDGLYIQDMAMKFCKQQALKKSIKDIQKIIDKGNLDEYEQCENILRKALEHGDNKDDGVELFDNIDSVLDDDFRKPIRTGIGFLDEVMDGGLSRGEVAVILAPFGVGKALPVSNRVYTPTGWIKMGDVSVGDEVIGRDGKPTKVIGVFPQGVRPIYKVSFTDGTATFCDEEHLWSVNTFRQRSNSKNPDFSYKVMKTSDMICNVRLFNDKFTNYKIPSALPVNFNKKDLLIEVKTLAKLLGTSIREKKDIPSLISCDVNKLKGSLSKLKLFNTTHESLFIPKDYLYSSIEDRIELLDRLVLECGDTTSKSLKIKTFSKEMCEDVRELALSLSYEVNYRLTRFGEYVLKIVKHSKGKFIKSIEYSHDEEAICIKVDNPEELFLTDDYIVTHNTTMVTKLASTGLFDGLNVLQIFFEDTVKVIQRKHIACHSGIQLNELSSHKDELAEIKANLLRNGGVLKLKKFSTDGTTMPIIRNYIRKLISSGFRPDIVLLDYIDCVQPSKHFDDVNAGEGSVMRQFESMASELNFAGWTAIQGNRSAIKSEVVEADQMGGSIKKAQIAHFIVSIAKTLEQKENNTATMAILKSRFGQSGLVFENIIFNNGTIQISDNTLTVGKSYSERTEDKDKEKRERLKLLMERKEGNI